MAQLHIFAGSESDRVFMKEGLAFLHSASIVPEITIASVHRKPRHAHRTILKTLRNNDVRTIIAGAHSATGLPGVIAGYVIEGCQNILVLGVRFTKEPQLSIMEDAAFGISSMPRGVPLAYTGFNNTGFLHACMLSVHILAIK